MPRAAQCLTLPERGGPGPSSPGGRGRSVWAVAIPALRLLEKRLHHMVSPGPARKGAPLHPNPLPGLGFQSRNMGWAPSSCEEALL